MMTRHQHNESKMARIHNTAKHQLDQGQPQHTRVKPRLLDLLNKHKVSTIHLALTARLHINTVRAMTWQGKPVQPVVAMQLLYGLMQLTGLRYVLTDVDIAVLPYK